jgi:hypothetical protein
MKWKEIAKAALTVAQRVEGECAGLSGEEKQKAFVKVLSQEVDLPWVPEPLESWIEPALYGLLAKCVVNVWNALTGKLSDWAGIELTPAQAEKAAALASVKLSGEPLVPPSEAAATAAELAADAPAGLDEKLDALYQKYAVKKDQKYAVEKAV